MTKYVCNECGWVGTRKEMYHEMGDGYDQDSCPVCHDILFDDMYGYVYCKDLRSNKLQKIKQIFKNENIC
jgi:hypothetical protein